jgi:hypothetical protein
MPRRSNYNPGQLAHDSRESLQLYYNDAPIPDSHVAFAIAGLQSLQPQERLPFLDDETALTPGLLALNISSVITTSDSKAQLWVYCGRRLWLPVTGKLHEAANSLPGRPRTNNSLRTLIAVHATSWVMMPAPVRVFYACLEAAKDILPKYWSATDDRVLYGNALEEIFRCGAYLPQGRAGLEHAATTIATLQQNGQLHTVQQMALHRSAMPHLLYAVEPQQRYPLLSIFAGGLGLRLDRPPNAPEKAGKKINSRALRFSTPHGQDLEINR